MKEETKQQAPAIGAIILAIVTAVTTTTQYCQTMEETRQIEATQARSTEAIIVGLSKEISYLQQDVDDLYRNTERLQIKLDVYRSAGMFGLPVSNGFSDSDADGVPDWDDLPDPSPLADPSPLDQRIEFYLF